MTPTTEVRWFFRGDVPDPVRSWFDGLGGPVEPERRTDRYLVPVEEEGLGLKVRAAEREARRIEAKQRTARLGPVTFGQAEGAAEGWRKGSWALAEAVGTSDPWRAVEKVRWQRRHAGERAGCTLELARVTIGGDVWWSVCLEADGPNAADRLGALHTAGRRWLDVPGAPALSLDASMGYPTWLRQVGEEGG